MKLNIRFVALSCLTLAIVASMTGCTDAGGVLAKESTKFAMCTLDQGQSCQLSAPSGTKVEKATVASADDAVRVQGMVRRKNECEGFAAHSKSGSPKHIAQAMINDIVVLPYGETMAHTNSVKTACATPPYKVSLTIAKAP